MRRHPIALAVVTFATALLVLAVSDVRVSSAAPRWGITGFLGYQGYTMDDVNSVIRQVNEDLSVPGRQVSIDELKGDVSFGGGVVADVTPKIRLYAEYERLKDHTGGGNQIGSFTLDVNSNTVLVGGTYFFNPEQKARLGLGAGVGYYAFGGESNGNATWGTQTVTGSQDISGNTIGFHGRGELDVALNESWHFDLALGYRSAKGEAEVGGDASGADLDWSGVMTRLGVVWFLP